MEPVSYNETADFYVQLLGGQEGFQEALVEVAVDAEFAMLSTLATQRLLKMPILQLLGAARVGFVGLPEGHWYPQTGGRGARNGVQSGIPVVPGGGPLERPEDIRGEVQRLGLPVWLKDGTGKRPVCLETLEMVEQVGGIRLVAGGSRMAGAAHSEWPIWW